MAALCPNCKEEYGDMVEREQSEPSGLLVTYSCPARENDWRVTF